eukprot:tig00001033_g6488.t2
MGGTDAQPRQRAQRAHLRALGLGLLVAGSMLLAALASASAHPSSPGSHERPRHADRGAADSPSSSNVNAASAAEPAGAGAYDRADVLRQLEELRGQMEHLKDSIASSKRPSLDQLQAPPAGASHEQNTPDKTAREAAQRQHALEELARRKARREEVERLRAAQEGHYIVGLKDGATEEHAEAVRGHARAAARRHHGAAHEEHVRIRRSFSRALRGFSARSVRASFPLPLPPPPPLLAPSRHTSASKLSPAVRAELEGHEHVKFVAPDGVRPAPPSSSSPRRLSSLLMITARAQVVVPAQYAIPIAPEDDDGGMTLDGRFDRGSAYGADVDIYVVDTGVGLDPIYGNSAGPYHPQIADRTVCVLRA